MVVSGGLTPTGDYLDVVDLYGEWNGTHPWHDGPPFEEKKAFQSIIFTSSVRQTRA